MCDACLPLVVPWFAGSSVFPAWPASLHRGVGRLRVCRLPVLRYDHHCVWIGACVGMRNHKLFFLFLLYTTLACAYALGLTVRFLLHLTAAAGPSAALHVPPPPRGLSPSATAAMAAANAAAAAGVGGGVSLSARSTVAVTILVPVGVMVAATAGVGAALLLGWNVACISRNRTTVEAHRCDDTTSHFVAPSYNRGVAANWRHVMGPTWWLWPLPVMEPRSGGWRPPWGGRRLRTG